MKNSKTKPDNKLSKKAVKRKIKKDLQRAISQKLAESIKSFGTIGSKIEKDLNKASKRLAKKLVSEFKGINEDFKQLQTNAKPAINSMIHKTKQTSLAEAKKVVAKAIKTNSPPRAVIPVKKRTPSVSKKPIISPKSFSNTSTTQSENTTLTTKPIVGKSDASDV